MAFKLKKSSCVAVGTFNIYIIQPNWLTKVGIFPEKTDVSIEASLDRPGFRFSSPDLKNTWVVFPGKLAVECESVGVDCGAPMARVLENLHWTPVFGLGNNIALQANRTEVESFPALEMLTSPHVGPEGVSLSSRALGTTVVRGGKVFNLGVTVTGDLIQLIGNAHLEMTPDGKGTESAVREAKAFEADTQMLMKLFTDVLGVRLP